MCDMSKILQIVKLSMCCQHSFDINNRRRVRWLPLSTVVHSLSQLSTGPWMVLVASYVNGKVKAPLNFAVVILQLERTQGIKILSISHELCTRAVMFWYRQISQCRFYLRDSLSSRQVTLKYLGKYILGIYDVDKTELHILFYAK